MSEIKRSIFRERAIQHYVQGREKNVLPRFISPPVFLYLWIIASLCLVTGWLSWRTHLPISLSGSGTIVASSSSDVAQAILFLPADQLGQIHKGETVQLHIGSSGPLLLRPVSEVEPTVLSPEKVRQQYHLDGQQLLKQPTVVVVVMLGTSIPASRYTGSSVYAEIRIGERTILSFLPFIGQVIGG